MEKTWKHKDSFYRLKSSWRAASRRLELPGGWRRLFAAESDGVAWHCPGRWKEPVPDPALLVAGLGPSFWLPAFILYKTQEALKQFSNFVGSICEWEMLNIWVISMNCEFCRWMCPVNLSCFLLPSSLFFLKGKKKVEYNPSKSTLTYVNPSLPSNSAKSLSLSQSGVKIGPFSYPLLHSEFSDGFY